MKRSSQNRSRKDGSQAAHTGPKGSPAIPEDEASRETFITAHCPNPECGKTYTIRSALAGKSGRCSCGTVFPISNTAEAHVEDRVSASDQGATETVTTNDLHAGDELMEVRVGCIGRGHAGKTALLRTLGEGPVGDFFPSGLHVDAGDPREVARMIRESEETDRLLHQFGLPPTLKASQIRYALYEGAVQRVVYKMREVIGQVLTHTLPDSAADQQSRYTDYLKTLVNTHVLWAVVPCQPANASSSDKRRYANDLRITLAYLREALRLRTLHQPVAVALILSKIDTLFNDEEEARRSLTDDVVRAAFGPLVHLVEQDPRVSMAAIIPMTTFGFGNAVPRSEGSMRPGTQPDGEGDPFDSEPIWLLREGASAQPCNLDTLFIWTLLYGLINRAGPDALDADTEIGQLCRTLADDLDALSPWLLTIKEDISLASAAPMSQAHA